MATLRMQRQLGSRRSVPRHRQARARTLAREAEEARLSGDLPRARQKIRRARSIDAEVAEVAAVVERVVRDRNWVWRHLAAADTALLRGDYPCALARIDLIETRFGDLVAARGVRREALKLQRRALLREAWRAQENGHTAIARVLRTRAQAIELR